MEDYFENNWWKTSMPPDEETEPNVELEVYGYRITVERGVRDDGSPCWVAYVEECYTTDGYECLEDGYFEADTHEEAKRLGVKRLISEIEVYLKVFEERLAGWRHLREQAMRYLVKLDMGITS